VSLEDVLERYASKSETPFDAEDAVLVSYQLRLEEAKRVKAGGTASETFRKEVFDRIRRQFVRRLHGALGCALSLTNLYYRYPLKL